MGQGGELSGALRRGTVKKNVAAIHVSGKLSLLQRKLSNVLLLNAYDDLTNKATHSIDARTLAMMVGYNSNDMDTLRDALRALAETVAEWDMLNSDGEQEWGVSALLAHARLKGGVCDYAYSPALAEKLHDPKVFALINLDIQKRFTSGHALALYENCYRFRRTGSTGWWDLDLFRRLMGVDGSAYYEVFKHLNAKIIKPAVAEVNRNSNIIVTPETRKKGRAVTDIRFLIKDNPQLSLMELDDGGAVRNSDIYQRLRGLGVADRLARQWLTEHGEDYVAQKLDLIGARSGIKSPLRYLSAAIANDYQDEASAKPEAGRAGGGQSRPANGVKDDAEQSARSAERAARVQRLERIQRIVAARNPTQRDADRKLFLSRLTTELDREDFRRHGWFSAINATAIAEFWEEMAPLEFAPSDEVDPA